MDRIRIRTDEGRRTRRVLYELLIPAGFCLVSKLGHTARFLRNAREWEGVEVSHLSPSFNPLKSTLNSPVRCIVARPLRRAHSAAETGHTSLVLLMI